MVNSLIRAAKRGVDVRIIVPGIPDQKIVYTLSSSFFKILHDNGVKIYKYSKGFVHSKVFLSDDIRAVVGTINMDYRSLYLHFECGCYFENNSVIKDIKKDVLDTFEKSHLVTKEEAKTNPLKSFGQSVLRLFAPLT
jgi:cardiolipin synthase